MRKPLADLSFAAVAAILLVPHQVFAQGRTTGGASSFGSLGSGGAGFGTSSFGGGGSSFGQSSFGQSSFGQSSFGGGSFGQSGTSAFGGTGAGGFGAETVGPTNQEFVGRRAADLESFFGGTNQQFQNAVQRSQRGGGSDGGGASSQRRPEVRVTIRVSEELRESIAAAGPELLGGRASRFAAASSSVARLLEKKGLPGVDLIAEGGVITLRGSVRSESERLVAEKLAAIEPGVDRVVNELVVADSDPAELLPFP